MYIGFGYDIHRLEAGRPLRLGGVDIPGAPAGPVAHSDGDVLLHALCDALLGAAGMGDIGYQFPDTDPAYKGMNSVLFLQTTMDLLRAQNLTPCNVDCTVVLEKPKILPYRESMRAAIAQVTGLDLQRISIKATTNEQLGFIGAGEGVAAYAVATLSTAS